MNPSILNPEENQSLTIEKDILSVFKQHPDKKNEIQQGMSPTEIAEIVSDELISIVRQQFEKAKKEFKAKSGSAKAK